MGELNGQNNMTRQQKRAHEQANEDAREMFIAMTKRFYDCFMENSPDSEEVKAMEIEVKAKWRMYCQNRKLLIPAYAMVENAIKEIRSNYEKAKADDSAQAG